MPQSPHPQLLRSLIAWAILLLPWMIACTTQGQETTSQIDPTGSSREALIQAFQQNRKMLYVYGSGDSAAATAYRALLTEIAQQSRRTQIIIRSDREVTEAELRATPLFLLGTPEDNAVLKRLLPQLPFTITERRLEFNHQAYGDHPVISLGFYPNPLEPSLPLSLMTGLDDQDIVANIRRRFQGQYYWFAFSGWGYELYDGGRRKVVGFFDESDPTQWKIGGTTHWDFSQDGKHFHDLLGFSFFAHQGVYPTAVADSIAHMLTISHQKIGDAVSMGVAPIPLEVHLYPTIELKGLATGNTQPVSLGNDSSSLHMVLHPAFAGRPQPQQSLVFIRTLLPAAKAPVMETGLATWATVNWNRLGWKHWARTWAQNGLKLSIAEMLDPATWEHESPYLKQCMSAALVDFIFSRWGREKLHEYYALSAASLAEVLLPFEQDFETYLRGFTAVTSGRNFPPLPAFHKAFNFAHEGYQIFNGYASKEATLSMNYLAREMHCNTVAIIPYCGYENVKAPGWFAASDGPGAENDESIIHCIWSAQQAGMQVMLKPQVWPWNDWTGEIEMQNEADWKVFFDRYYRWIRHYALMAELYGADILCIGVEMSKAVLQRPDDWRAMIGKLRGIYGGKLTYAANWGDEFEHCTFWDAVDFIGINCYYPLTKKENASQKELDKGFSGIMDKIEGVALAADKDVLFTEIGFRSVENTWINPYAEADDRKADNAAQAACYKAMIKGMEGRDWCRGVYLWKWPAYMADARYDMQGFTPLGRPSEGLVREWFGE